MELIVLTTSELAAGSRELPRFVAFREAEGWEVTLATETDWDHPAQTSADSRQDRIRAWLKERYAEDPGAFLLLIGDPDPATGDIPMLETYPIASLLHYYPPELQTNMSPIPTDFYYAELTGEWDCDGDGRPWHYPRDIGEGCMDMMPELYVGRLPVYDGDVGTMDALLERALERDLETDKSYRHTVLLPGALFGIDGTSTVSGGIYQGHSDGGGILATIHRDLPAVFESVRLFEGEGLLESAYERDLDLSRDQLLETWAQGAGVVVWAGHGWKDSTHRVVWVADLDEDGIGDDDEVISPSFIESGDEAELVSAGGAFTWHVSCDNAWPESEDNLATALLSGGAAGTVAATRVSYGSTPDFGETWEPRPELAGGTTASYYYALALTDGATSGEALARTKSELPGDGWTEVYAWVDTTGFAWATRAMFNLYGDPTRSLELCQQDSDCLDDSLCTGTEACQDGFCIHQDAPDCAELDSECSVGVCDPQTGGCTAEPRFDGAPCDDGAWCTESDTCGAGVCGGVLRDCGEREGYLSTCDDEAGVCLWEELDEEATPRAETRGCASAGAAGGWLGMFLLPALVRRRKERPFPRAKHL
ncbi:MAG TPA: C25 family cysteine peptidase [Myxococcota bacterium]|nr:C25 family cysteine peptidase [Myxococcota bacterium]